MATLTPQAVPAGAGETNVTLTVLAAKRKASLINGSLLFAELSSTMIGITLLSLGEIRRRVCRHGRTFSVLFLAVTSISLLGLNGCGSPNAARVVQQPTQQPTSYTVTVTATSGALSHSTTLKLTVQ